MWRSSLKYIFCILFENAKFVVRRTAVLLKRNGFPIRLRYTSPPENQSKRLTAFACGLRPLALDPKGHAERDPPLRGSAVKPPMARQSLAVARRSEALASRSHSYTQVFIKSLSNHFLSNGFNIKKYCFFIYLEYC